MGARSALIYLQCNWQIALLAEQSSPVFCSELTQGPSQVLKEVWFFSAPALDECQSVVSQMSQLLNFSGMHTLLLLHGVGPIFSSVKWSPGRMRWGSFNEI